MSQSKTKPGAVAPEAGGGAHPLHPEKRFFENGEIRELVERATDYVRAGVCVHLTGTAGVGKTSLAFRIAGKLGRPVALMLGNEWLTSRDFIGQEIGTTTSSVVDRYVQSVRRTEKKMVNDWQGSILAEAMRKGHTLVYDEFTRATPEANANLLSVLEEGVLVSTDSNNPTPFLRAHPDFRIILTSNPHDYVAVNSAPDALMDRVVTLPIQEPGVETMAHMVAQRTGLGFEFSHKITKMVAHFRSERDCTRVSTMRSAILIARIAAAKAAAGTLTPPALAKIASDVLAGRGIKASGEQVAAVLKPKKAA